MGYNRRKNDLAKGKIIEVESRIVNTTTWAMVPDRESDGYVEKQIPCQDVEEFTVRRTK